jgi:hypothetical protein
MNKVSEFLVKNKYHRYKPSGVILWALKILHVLLRQYSERENFGEHYKIVLDIAIIYYISEFKYPEISIFRNTAVTNIRKYQTYVIQVCTVGQ